eukprot:3575020-Pleurochrysis_carterae.AAC.1
MVARPQQRRNVPQYVSRVGVHRPNPVRGRVCCPPRDRGGCRSFSPQDLPVAETRICRRVA